MKTTKGTVRGYFDNPKTVVTALSALPAGLEPEGVYVTLNPLSPSLLARAVNRFGLYAKTRAGNIDVLRRLWLPIDADPVRPAGISATNEELAMAVARTDAAVAWLTTELGWPVPVRGSGGNSGHALFAINEPNDSDTEALMKRVYAAVALRFSDSTVKVDTAVSNAARIWTIYGTKKRKGDDTAGRPHRLSWIDSRPDPFIIVTREQLEGVAALAETPRPRTHSTTNRTTSSVILDMAAEFSSRGWYLRALTGGLHAVTCPWVADHSGTSGLSETVLFEPRDLGGVWGFKCQHSHCATRTIKDVWELVRPSWDAARSRPASQANDLTCDGPNRSVQLTPASAIRVRPVRWAWQDRAPLGALALLGGREGVGKTILAYTLAAHITRGTLPGAYFGTPRAVIVAATEDSWEHTIVPRLMAADADLDRVYRVDVTTPEGTDTALSLPRDLVALERIVREVAAALIILDPLISRLDKKLDTHKDAEVRNALEPLVTLANTTDACVLGLIHVNKSSSSDVLTMLMGSRAFVAVARAVLFVMVDPDNEQVRLLGLPKNNLGRTDVPTLTFRIVGVKVTDTPEGEVWTGKLEWLGESDRSIQDAVTAAAANSDVRTVTTEAATWLTDYLTRQGGGRDCTTIKRDGAKAGHSIDALKRARKSLGILSEGGGFPRKTYWVLPVSQCSPGESLALTALTAPTDSITNKYMSPQSVHVAPTGPSVGAVGAVGAVGGSPPRDALPEPAADEGSDDDWGVPQ